MPSDAAVSRERQVVHDVMDALRSASGLHVELIGSPDEERGTGRFPDGLTVDALVRLSEGARSCTWAVDVMNLSWDNRLVPAISGFEERMKRELEAIAAACDVRLVVMYRPPVGNVDRGDAYLQQMLDFAKGMVAGEDMTSHPLANDSDTHLSIETPRADADIVEVLTGLTTTADVGEQLRETLVPPLRKKLTGQLRRAHDLSYPTLLAIDRVGPPARVGNNFVASAGTVGQVVAQTVLGLEHRGAPHCLDLAVLVDRSGCSPVFGYWPKSPCP